MYSFRFTSGVGKHTKTILSYTMGQKLSSKLLFISSPNTDVFYGFHISQGSAATQLRYGGMFSNHFITNFRQNAPVKKFENRSIFGKDMDKSLWLTFFDDPVVYCGRKR